MKALETIGNKTLYIASNLEVKLGDIVARDPMDVYPVYDINDNLVRYTGVWEVTKITTDSEYTNIAGVNDCYKRLNGKPIYILV